MQPLLPLALVSFLFAATAASPALAKDDVAAAPAGDLWLDQPSVTGDAIWFPDELVPLAEAAAEVLARPESGGYRVIPFKEVRALWSEVRAGHLPGVRAVCEAAPPPWRLALHHYRGASNASLKVECPAAKKRAKTRPDCTLEIVVFTPRPTGADPDKLDETGRFRAKLPPGESPGQWAERLRTKGLQRAKPPKNAGGLGLVGYMGEPPEEPPFRVELSDVTRSPGWQGFREPPAAPLWPLALGLGRA